MAAHITFEQFLHHTNAEEIIVKKMKEAGPRIFQLNYDRRLKHCKVLYKKFYDTKLRDTVIDYGLVLKPMPNSFKTKFLQFPPKNNDGEYNSSDTAENKSVQKKKNKLPPLEDKYKDDLPSTSTAFIHKPRIISQSEKNKTKTKTKLKSESQKQQRDMSSSKTNKISTKSAPKRGKSLEQQKSSKKSAKITKYFNSNASNTKVDEQPIPEGNMKLRKRISDSPNKNIEIEPQTKRKKISPAKKIDTKREADIIKSNNDPLISKTSPKDKKEKYKIKNRNKCDGKKNSLSKSRTRLHSDDFVSDDCDINTNNSITNLICDINTNNSIINLSSEDSRDNIQNPSPDRKLQNNCSPLKSALPKRNRIEDYGETSNTVLKKNEISPQKVKKPKNGFTKNEIELWITEGQKALEENNKMSCKEGHPDKHITLREDISVDYKLQTIKTHPDKVKKYIKYWLKFEIQMRKGINLEATVVSEISRAKILSTFNQMTYEDFKNLINVERSISHWTSLGKSIDEFEQNLKNHYTAFIGKEKSWPAFHIELARLQTYLHSKGIKGSIPLKNIPPRILSFDEVLEKTNIKECISLSCDKPPESYTELMNLCKKEYEKCCCIGVWTEGLKFNDKGEEGGSSQEMSIELFTEPPMSTSPIKVNLDSGKIQENVAQKELPILQNLDDNNISSNNFTKKLSNNEQNECADHSKNSTTKQRKSRKWGPKSRRRNSSRSDDDLENQINQICGYEEQSVLKNTIEPMMPIDTQELNRILTHSQTQQSLDMGKEIPHSEKKNSTDIPVGIVSITPSMEKVVDNNQRDVTEHAYESLIKTRQTSGETSVPTAMDNPITPSPNIFEYSDETNTKCSNIQMTNNATKTPPNIVSKKKPMQSPSPNIFANNDENNRKCSNIQMTNESSKTPPNAASKKKPLQSTEIDEFMQTPNDKSSDKQPKLPEKENLIPLSPNIFQSSGESYFKNVDTHLIDVQTQESVYVACETNNDFHTEQNNFSITINEVNESEDPFGETIANQEETIVVRLDQNHVEVNSEKSSENALVTFGELNIQEESTSITENSDSNQVATKEMQNSINSQESMVSKELSMSCQAVSVEPQETTDSHQTHVCETNASEKPTSVASNLDQNQIIESEETIVLKELLLSCQTVSVESSVTNNNNKEKNDLCSTEPSSNPSYETSDIVDCMNTTLEPAPHLNTDALNLVENAKNKEKKNSVSTEQLIEPTPDVSDVIVNLDKTIQTRNKTIPKENVPSIQPDQNSSITSECFVNPADNQKDMNGNRKQKGAKLKSDHNSISNKNKKKNIDNKETDLNTSTESLRNVKVVVKREIFSQSFSQYDDEVQIIEIPQSEPMVIDDEETAPELLEALLCSSPPQTERAPMTIVHTSISHVTPSSIYLDNFPQAQQFPSNFDLTQSQSNSNQSCNVSKNSSSGKVNIQTTTKNTDNVCDSSDCHNFKTPNNQAANINCSANIVLKKSPDLPEATESKSQKKTSDRKRKLVSNKPVSSSKSKDDKQLSEEMSDMSYVSIAPQNIPSEIEFTQTTSKSGESEKHMEKAKKDDKQNKKSRNNNQESGVSMLVCISDSFDETNKTSMNLEKSKNIEENIKTEEYLKLNKIQDLSTPEENKDVETIETSKDNPDIDEEDVGSRNVEQSLIAALDDSLDRSSDVQILEESTKDDIEDAVSLEISNNNKLLDDCEEDDRVDDECCSYPSKDIAQKQAKVCGDNDFIKEKSSSNNSDVMDMEVSKTKELSMESKKDNVEALNPADATPCYSKENLNTNEFLKENNTAENVNTSVEVLLSMNDSIEVELLEESEEDDDVPVDCVASLSQPSSVINKISNSIPENKEANTEVAEKLKDSFKEEDNARNEQTVEKSLYPKITPQTKGPIYHVLVGGTNTFEIYNIDETDAKTCEEADNNNHIKEFIKPMKACKVRMPKINIQKADLSPKEVRTYLKRPGKASKCRLAKGNKNVFLPKETCQASKMAGYPEESNLVIQSTTEVTLTEKESEIEKILSKDIVSNKIVTSLSHDLEPIENSIVQNFNEHCKDQISRGQEKSSINNTKSNSKHPFDEPIQIAAETCKNWDIKVPDVELTISTTATSQHLENISVFADHSSVNVNSDVEDIAFESNSTKQEIESVTIADPSSVNVNPDVEDIAFESNSTKQEIESVTIEHHQSSETTEYLLTSSSVSGKHKTNAPDVSKNIFDTPLSTKNSQDHNKNDKNISSSESSSESFQVDVNLKAEIQENVQLKSSDEILSMPSPSRVINKTKNTSENETYSKSFATMDNTNAIGITTSTQVELPVSNQKENGKENYIASETSSSSSVEFIDFSFYYISSDDENYTQNDDSEKEKKYSHTLNFKELSISQETNTADVSKAINDPNNENEELLRNLSEGSECILPVDISSIIQDRSIDIIPKVSEVSTFMLDSKIIFNRNDADSSCNKSLSVLPTNPKISFNLNKSYDSAISNNSKITNSEENLTKTQAPVCGNKTSNSSTDLESVELTDKEDFVTTRKLSKDCDPVNRVVNAKNKISKDNPPENSSDQENLQLSKNLQSEEFEENNTVSLKKCYILKEDNTQTAIDTNLIDKQSSEDQDLSSLGRNICSYSKRSKNIQKAVEQVMQIKKNVNKNIRRRSTSEQYQQSVTNTVRNLSFSQPSGTDYHSEVPEKFPNHPEIFQTFPKLNLKRTFKDSSQKRTEITTKNVETTMSTKLRTITLQGFILTASLKNIQPSNEDYVEVPIMIEKRLFNILPSITKISESIQTNVELKLDDQQFVSNFDSNPMTEAELKSPTIPLISYDEKRSKKSEKEVTAEENAEHNNSPKKHPIQLVYKAKTKIAQPSTSKKKTTPKKSSKLPDFVQQKTHAFSTIPLKPCHKPSKSKPPSLLTVEECDYLIEDASQPIATTTASQILGTDCTYFENSELLRNLDEICIPHPPEITEPQIEQLPPQIAASTPTTFKVNNLIPITLSEGVTARKVWQVNLQWKSQKAMSIEVRFSVNRRSMTVCDESAKLLFTFKPEIWSDVHRVLREINHFEYKRRAFKNQLKTTALHKVLRQLFDSSTQVVDVKLINDNYNPYTICEKTIPVYRKPFQCLTKGIAPDILSKMRFLKEKLQNNNQELN